MVCLVVVLTWGCGSTGALGHADTADALRPTLVKDLEGTECIKIAAGQAHMLAATARELYAWGW